MPENSIRLSKSGSTPLSRIILRSIQNAHRLAYIEREHVSGEVRFNGSRCSCSMKAPRRPT